MNINPQTASLGALALGTVLAVAGVYVLAGPGWALVASSVPCFGVFAAIQSGLRTVKGSRHG
jgi:uncharacterized membrane protein HdeD (DUF308 family)